MTDVKKRKNTAPTAFRSSGKRSKLRSRYFFTTSARNMTGILSGAA
eukprot:CAMPEP_0175293262 /NCGR_PEP_ID=MMETSP0093-20121207/57379_1 /TAXON_ID=311494 /ORGANISM="Alexandrium monilatum, Strain CCMP3105" /LENGTH=45 /DNA_ID= /DNA_START= /DNA_END= /DNA_ORIENTATION=